MEEQRIESEENQLRNELEKICLDYKELVKKSAEMAPKDANTKKTGPNGECEVNDDEFEEIAEVADNLNSLELALDQIEQRADQIRLQLLELLTSNREIRQSLREENNKAESNGESNHDDPNNQPDAEPSNN